MKKLLTLILFLFCLPVMAQHISIGVVVPGVYIHYNNGYRYHRDYDRGYYRPRYDYYPREVVVYSAYPYRYHRFHERYEHEPYIIRDERPVIYNRYPSGYNYTLGR